MRVRLREGRPSVWPAVGVGLLVVAGSLAGLSAFGRAGPAGAPGRKPELARVVKVPGVVRQEQIDRGARSVFAARDGGWSAVLLETQVLAALEDRLVGAPRNTVVEVTGVVSEYRGQNYLLLVAAEVRLAPVGGP